jgi:AsmA family protein
VPVATDDHIVSRDSAFVRAHAVLRRRFAGYRWSWIAFLEWAGALLIALIIGAIAWLYFLDWNTMRGPVGRYVSHRLGREVRIVGDLKVHLFSRTPSVSADNVQIVNPVWAKGGLAAHVGHYQMTVKLWPLLRGKTVITDLEFDTPDIVVLRDAQGRTNWDGIGGKGDGAKLPPIQHFIIRNGHLAIDDRVRRMTFQGAFASNEQAGAGDRAFALTGDGLLNSNKFTADVHGGPLINVDESKPYHLTANLSAGATHVAINGVLPRPFHLGQFQATTEFSGPTMSDLYYLSGLVFPMTPPYHLTANAVRDGSIYHLTNLKGVIGSSDMQGEMMVDAGQTPTFLSAKLNSRVLSFSDLGPLIGSTPSSHVKAGLPAPKVSAAAKAVAGPFALPDTPLDIHRVRQMNADVTYSAASLKSQDFPLRDFHMHLALNNGVMMLDPLTFDFIRGKLSGSVKIDARKDVPVSDVDARLTDIRLEQFVKGSPPPLEGLLEARAKLHAVGNSMHKAASNADGAVTMVVPSGKMRKSFAELTGIDALNGLGLLLANDKSDTGVRCAVARFDAHQGQLTTEQMVLDTDSVLIQAKGNVDMKTERMAFEVKGEPKSFRIGRIRAPITVDGPIASPHVGVKASAALGQGGIAVALGFINPLASILAFVDPGLTKDANCTALTSSATKGAAPVKATHKASARHRH